MVVRVLRSSLACDRKATFIGPWNWPLTVVRNPTTKYMNVRTTKGPNVYLILTDCSLMAIVRQMIFLKVAIAPRSRISSTNLM